MARRESRELHTGGKVMEQVILEAISKYLKDRKVIVRSQHAFTKGLSCLTNQLAFSKHVTGLVDEAASHLSASGCCLSSVRSLAVSHKILTHELMKYRLNKWTVRWTESWQNCWGHGVVISDMKSSWRLLNSGLPQGSMLGTILCNILITELDDG